MKIIKGTQKAGELLSKLADQGDLVDVYSKSFFDRQPSFKDDQYAAFNREGFDYLFEEYEDNPESDIKPLGHLLFVHVDDYKKDMHKSLVELYEPLANLIDSGKHKPDFLLINLYTKQVLCIGLGRKNRLFMIDAPTGKSVNAFGLLGSSISCDLIFGEDSDYMARFIEHDIYESVSDFVNAVYELGVAMYSYDNMEFNLEQIENALASEPNEDGEYHLEDGSGLVNEDEGFTKNSLLSMVEQINAYQAQEDESMKMINIFFPQCERGELNTGDY
jgi:hypothetical protein